MVETIETTKQQNIGSDLNTKAGTADTKSKTIELVNNEVLTTDIKDLILTVRGKQVLLDSDVARLYGYETKRINETATRNIKRFPPEFRFQLTSGEVAQILRCQFGTFKEKPMWSQIATTPTRRNDYLPYAYTEAGIGMLSGLLRNDTAVQVSIGIMKAFVEMRKFLNANQDVFAKIVSLDNRLSEHDNKFDEVFDLLQQPDIIKQSIFYKGQFYDAYQLIRDIIKQAKHHITIIDNYVDGTLLDTLTYKSDGVVVTVITSSANKISAQALLKFKKQYGQIDIVVSKDFHDRFIILDNKEVYALGASIKDLGNKCFEISKNQDTLHFCDYVEQVVNKQTEVL